MHERAANPRCRYTTTVASYLFGALGELEREEFRRHASSCADCGQAMTELLPVVLLLEKAPRHSW